MSIIDNINNIWKDDLKPSLQVGSKLKIAAASFSIYSFEILKEELQKIDSLQFIFTTPTFVPDENADILAKEHKEFHIPHKEREKNLHGNEFEIHLRNKLTQKAIAKECALWIKEKVTFKSSITNSLMQQFAYLENKTDKKVYSPIQGFTTVSLGYQRGNAHSNLINKIEETSSVKAYLETFQSIWNDSKKVKDVTNTICNAIETVYKENSPEKIYFLILYTIFREFLEDLTDDVLPNELTGYKDSLIWKKLFPFQQDAATGIINKLEKFNACILADSVGLGKTFSALAVIKYYELKNRSVLVLCPKKLEDNWKNYTYNGKTNLLAKDRFNYDVLFHSDLSRDKGMSGNINLSNINWNNYDLLVIDESHNFRNNNAYNDKETRYQKLLTKVIGSGVKTKVLMLSATPVNNRFIDLKNQLALAYEGTSETLSKKLKINKSIEEIFRQAQTVFNSWAKQSPLQRTTKNILDKLDFEFFELLDNVTIARSRKHIEAFYSTEEIGQFPERKEPIPFRPPLTKKEDIMSFNDIAKQLTSLKLSVYAPLNYILSSQLAKYEGKYDTLAKNGKSKFKQVDRERSLQALMTTNLLKRLESSIESFRLTLGNLEANYKDNIQKINSFKQNQGDSYLSNESKDISALSLEDEELANIDDFIGKKIKINLADIDLCSWERDLKTDCSIISNLLKEMKKIEPEDDSKLQHLKKQIVQKINNPINKGNKKVLIFTAFADTANYLYKNIAEDSKSIGLHTAKVTGNERKSTLTRSLGNNVYSKHEYDFQEILTLFSPKSKQKEAILPDETREIDILIGTDCISEGQNLQDCDYVINYDIHWNPVRIIQRFGRIDRIGSTNQIIQLVNYWPDITLDEYIKLKERVENRMVIADIAATGEDNLLATKSKKSLSSEVSYRTEQLKKLQHEVLAVEEVKTGISITDLGLNDFRIDLLNYMKTNQKMSNLPNGLHTIIPPNKEQGLEEGVIYILCNRNTSLNKDKPHQLHPYYLIYVKNDETICINHTEVKRLLDLLRSNCKGVSEPIQELCKQFNVNTQEGLVMQHYSNLLKKAIESIIEVQEEADIESLFTGYETTALDNSIKGIDDFELIAFIVIQGK